MNIFRKDYDGCEWIKCSHRKKQINEDMSPFEEYCNFHKKRCIDIIYSRQECFNFKYNYKEWLIYDIKQWLQETIWRIQSKFKNKEIQELRARVINLEKKMKYLEEVRNVK